MYLRRASVHTESSKVFSQGPLFRSHSLLPRLLLKGSKRLLKLKTQFVFFIENERFCVSNFCRTRSSYAHGCHGSGSTLGHSRKQLANGLREELRALLDETHPADSSFLQTETRGRQMSIDVHPSLRRCLEKKSNSQDHRNEKTRSRRYEKL